MLTADTLWGTPRSKGKQGQPHKEKVLRPKRPQNRNKSTTNRTTGIVACLFRVAFQMNCQSPVDKCLGLCSLLVALCQVLHVYCLQLAVNCLVLGTWCLVLLRIA